MTGSANSLSGSERSNRSCQRTLRRSGGAVAVRVTDAANAQIDEHAHDWPVLSLYVSGALRNLTAAGETILCGPSVVLYGAGAEHANFVGEQGFEQIQIEFDPAWLRLGRIDLSGPHHWTGGKIAMAARSLAAKWVKADTPEAELSRATSGFLVGALQCREAKAPIWLGRVSEMLASRHPPSSHQIASELGLNLQWLRQAYRTAVGEGIGETIRRRKVEAAAGLLRSTTLSAAQVAAEVGFFDQSHMIRCFTAVLGRTPGDVRSAEQILAG
jgi:AraC family transcriptional regulator